MTASATSPSAARGIVFSLLAGLILAGSDAFGASSIAGVVRDWDGAPLQNVSVRLSGDSTGLDVTDALGQFDFAGLNGSSYTVYVDDPDRVFTPATRTYVLSDTTVTGQDFVFGKDWTGLGADHLASNPENWANQEIPRANERVRFGSTSPAQGCFWDLNVAIGALVVDAAFSSSVVAGLNMTIDDVEIGGGAVRWGAFEHLVTGDYTHTAGTFTAAVGGTILFNDASDQAVTMVVSTTAAGHQSYFFNFRAQAGGTLHIDSDVVIDGSFSISTRLVDATNATITMTGGINANAGEGPKLNWSEGDGSFIETGSHVRFENDARDIRLTQKAGNAFHDLTFAGARDVESTADVHIVGDFVVTPTSAAVFDVGNQTLLIVDGLTTIGPSDGDATALRLGDGNANFFGAVKVASAGVAIEGLEGVFNGGLTAESRGVIEIRTTAGTQLSFPDGERFLIDGGTFAVRSAATLTSTSPGNHHFSLLLNGVIDVDAPLTVASTDDDGMRFGAGATPLDLRSLSFTHGTAIGTALNFDPVPVDRILIDGVAFDVSFSTNVRAAVDGGVAPDPDIDIINSAGLRAGQDYENDPQGVVNWGLIGTPGGFAGASLSSTSVRWSWEIVNHPLGFIVMATSGGAVSPSLPAGTSTWTELGATPDVRVSRYVEAFTDVESATSAAASARTLAAAPASLSFSDVHVTSVTLSWSASGNPPSVLYAVERSSSGPLVRIASGTYAAIQPYVDTGLEPQRIYTYRVVAVNGDALETPSANAGVTTNPVPPPVVASVTPSTAPNLGRITLEIDGSNFLDGATLRIRHANGLVWPAEEVERIDMTRLHVTIDMTGAFAGNWSVDVTNPDGKQSGASGADVLTVANASSTAFITIADYAPAAQLDLVTPTDGTLIEVPAGALGVARFYVTEAPDAHPLDVDPGALEQATNALTGWRLIPDTVREVLAFTESGRHTAGFFGNVFLSIPYPDADGNGIVDGINARLENVQMMTLSEAGQWTPVAAAVDEAARRVVADVPHFSVYALFGAAHAADLSGAKVYPNPWRPGAGGPFDATSLTIGGLTESGIVRIFSLDGGLIRELPYDATDGGAVEWDGETRQGLAAASGVYLLAIDGGAGAKTMLKLGVER